MTVLSGVTVPSARICTSMVSRRTGTAWIGVRRFASRGPKKPSRCGGGVAGPPQYQTAAVAERKQHDSENPVADARTGRRGGRDAAAEDKSGLLIDDGDG